MDTAQRLRAALIADSGVTKIAGQRVHQSRVPNESRKPYIWFTRRGTIDDECLAPAVGAEPKGEQFDLECWSPSLDESQAMADAVRTALANTRHGTWQGGLVAGIFVTDQNDDYAAQGADDETIFYSAINVEVHYQ